ncbi:MULTISPECIES: hypothetical protein [Serratia]|uniref:HTH cro/C1-type domain-containing protein n=2 Tax=Serratia TaxID=613 RepID=A0ABT8LW67_9GAMM|nr:MULTISPECIES: hypothetical protein [Serratia]MDN6881547.1 hypothetical protein [Serratia bockelmannii]
MEKNKILFGPSSRNGRRRVFPSLCSRTRAFRGLIMPLVATFRTDWFRVITDINRTRMATQSIAEELGVSKSAVLGWKSGSEPRHGDGEALIALWCQATGSDRSNLPTVLYRQWWTFKRPVIGRESDRKQGRQ